MSGLLGAHPTANGAWSSIDVAVLTATKFKKENMYWHPYPDGTIHAIDLPPDIYSNLMQHVTADGTVSDALGPVYGNYINFGTYRIKVTIYEVTPTTFKIRLV